MFPNGETTEEVQFSSGVYCENPLQWTPIVQWSNFRQHRTPARGTQDVNDQVETVSASHPKIPIAKRLQRFEGKNLAHWNPPCKFYKRNNGK